MKSCKKLLILLLSVIIFVVSLSVAVFAAGGNTNVSLTTGASEVNVGDTFTVTLSCSEMTVKTFTAGVKFDSSLVECVSIVGPRSNKPENGYLYDPDEETWVKGSLSTVEQAKEASQVGMGYASTDDVLYDENVIFTVTFKAIAAGEAAFTSYENTNGTDAFKSDNIETKTVTIKSAHTCTHDHYETENNKHQSVCACGEYIGEAANCEISKETKKCTECGEDCSHINFANSSVRYTDNGNGTHIYKVSCNDCNDWGIKDAAQTCVDSDSNGYCDLCHVHSGWTDNGDGTCSQVCACGLNNGPSDHVFIFGTCSRCDAPQHTCSTATLDGRDGQGATCTVDGWNNYFECSSCGKLYADDACTTEITDFDAWKTGDGKIPAGHAYGTLIPAEGAVHTQTELKGAVAAHYFCDVCDTYFTEEKVATTLDALTGDAPVHAPADYADNGNGTHTVKCSCDKVLDPAEEHNFENAAHTCACGAIEPTGWLEIEDAWYYVNADYTKATGLTRVPYNTELDHAANDEDVAYAEGKNQTYVNKATALYLFDENGKLLRTTGIIANKYYADGIQLWHPGFVEVSGVWYYFVGDGENGGNKLAQGQIYVTRNYEAAGYSRADQVTFVDGKVDTSKDGVVDGFYYEDGKLARGKGLVKLENGKYIYVRSAGQLATGVYYVGEVKYEFDENGYSDGAKNGLVGDTFYINGHVAYGLVEYEGDIYYVRSNGKVATGTYYITETNSIEGFEKGDKLYFDEDGKMLPIKNGVVDGYYYEKNHVKYGAGLVEYEGGYIYVRSNGKVAVDGEYWVTNTNGLMNPGKATFDKDGMLVTE